MDVTYVFLGLSAAILALSIYAYVDLKGYLSKNAAITDDDSMEGFKVLVRKQMKLALVAVALIIPAGLVGFYGIFCADMSFLLFLCVNGVTFGFSKVFKHAEERARLLRVDEDLKEEYRAVCESWVKKALPEF